MLPSLKATIPIAAHTSDLSPSVSARDSACWYTAIQKTKQKNGFKGELLENAQMIPSPGFLYFLCSQYLYKRRDFFFLPQISAPWGAAMLVCSLPMKSRKGLAPVMADIFATQASFAYDVTGTRCWAQNGSTHSCCCWGFLTFKH